MTAQPIRLFGDPVLRTKADPVTVFDKELRQLVTDLTETMLAAPGSGLAAPQIGVGLRVFTYHVGEDQQGHLVNPVLHFPSDEEQVGDEGCLSIPGLLFDCRRKEHVVAHGQNMWGDPLTVEGTEKLSRAIQHETDHLDGVLFVDRLDPATRRAAMRAIREAPWSGQATRPVVKLSPHPTPGVSLRPGPVRLLFAGTPEAAVPALKALIDSPRHDVVGVLTRPDAPAGRGRRLSRSPVGHLADEAGLPVFTPRRPGADEFVDVLTALAPDCAPVVAYGALLPARILLIPRYGWVNLHFSILPAWRGAAPVQHALLAGDEITGASTFLIEQGLDTGPVFGVTTEAIRPDDTAGTLLGRLSVAGAGLLTATLDALDDHEIAPRDQPADGVSLAPKVTIEDARVDFAQSAVAVDRRVRACTPAPGPWTPWRGDRLKLGPVHIVAAGGDEPGRLSVTSGAVHVGTGTQAVALSTVQQAGRRPMPAIEWARGARIGDGDRLG